MAATAQDILDSINELQERLKALDAKVDKLLDAPAPKPQNVTELSASGQEVKVMELDVTLISVGLNKSNEKAFRLKGHPFTKFGVAVYDDGNRLEQMGIDPALDFGDHPYSQRVVIQMSDPNEDGRSVPKRVLRLAG